MGVPGGANLLLAGGGAAYEINQSLRFNSADSAYLNRTPASAGNRKTWTWSGWLKRSRLSTADEVFFNSAGGTDSTRFDFFWISNDTFEIDNYNTRIVRTTQVFRDPSAWYHLVVALDTTQATASNRLRVYINGQEITSFSIDNRSTAISQNADMGVNGTTQLNVGGYTSYYYNGYAAEVNLIDGTALTPSSFGETDTITGAWIPKKYSGSYGTNGFYLKFQSSGIGTDSSGNGNNFTSTGFSTSGTGTDVMSDTPTNNYATINPLFTNYSGALSDGNLVLGPWSDNGWNRCVGTISQNSGKWYFEVTANNSLASDTFYNGIGVAVDPAFINSANLWGSSGTATSYAGLLQSDEFYPFSNSTYGTALSGSFSSGAVMQCAIDIDAGKLWFGVANSWIGGGNPASGTTPTYTITANAQYYFGAVTYGSGSKSVLNYGQRSFNQTPPTGFKALNTANLPEPTIKKGSTYFNTVAYSGSSSNQAITVGFEPDFLWIKRRNGANDHNLYNAIVGLTGNYLVSNGTGGENGNNNRIVATSSTGFTVGTGSADTNGSGNTYVAWAWDANGAGSSNTAGTITSTVSANATAGFSIVTYTGAGSAGTVGHGLGVAPSMVITKDRGATYDWYVYHRNLSSGYYLRLNDISGQLYEPNLYSSAPTSTVINYGSSVGVVRNGANYVAYCFSEVAGYSKFGSYVGNGSTDGTFVYCGFKPAFVLVKRTDGNNTWTLWDNERPAYNEAYYSLIPNTADQEQPNEACDLLSNGFKLRRTPSYYNGSGNSYIFAAFAENPFKYANAR